MKTIFPLALICLLALSACHPKNGGTTTTPPSDTTSQGNGGTTPTPDPTPAETQAKLVAQYERGEVEQCTYQGATVYRCSRNAPDAGSEVFNAKAERIGRCYYSTNVLDPVCKEATGCKVIYRMANNIWGKPAVAWVKPE
jgi:hypothetical protein